jgi:hypothetical protein
MGSMSQTKSDFSLYKKKTDSLTSFTLMSYQGEKLQNLIQNFVI